MLDKIAAEQHRNGLWPSEFNCVQLCVRVACVWSCFFFLSQRVCECEVIARM